MILVRAMAIVSGVATLFGLTHLATTIVLIADSDLNVLGTMPHYFQWTAAAAISLLCALFFSLYIANTRLPRLKGILWSVAILYLLPVSLPVFWILHIRPLLWTREAVK